MYTALVKQVQRSYTMSLKTDSV